MFRAWAALDGHAVTKPAAVARSRSTEAATAATPLVGRPPRPGTGSPTTRAGTGLRAGVADADAGVEQARRGHGTNSPAVEVVDVAPVT